MVKDKSAYKHVRISLELWRRTKVACVGVEEGIGAFAERAIEERLRGMVEGSISGGRKVVEVGWKPPASLPSKVSESRGSLAEANEAIVEALPEVRAGLRESDARAAVGVAEATFAPTLGGEVPVRERAEVLKDFHAVEHEGEPVPPVDEIGTISLRISETVASPSPSEPLFHIDPTSLPKTVRVIEPDGRESAMTLTITDGPSSGGFVDEFGRWWQVEGADTAEFQKNFAEADRLSKIPPEPRVDVGPTKDELF